MTDLTPSTVTGLNIARETATVETHTAFPGPAEKTGSLRPAQTNMMPAASVSSPI
jgi:glutamate synthase (NADPH) large chain